MIEYSKTKPGDKLKIVGMGAPGFAVLGEVVTVTKVGENRCYCVNAAGEEVFFALTCGASRLEPVGREDSPQ